MIKKFYFLTQKSESERILINGYEIGEIINEKQEGLWEGYFDTSTLDDFTNDVLLYSGHYKKDEMVGHWIWYDIYGNIEYNYYHIR